MSKQADTQVPPVSDNLPPSKVSVVTPFNYAPTTATWPILCHDLVTYGVLWIVALLLSLLHYDGYVKHLPPDKPAPHTELRMAYAAPSLLNSLEKKCESSVLECKVDSLAERLHPAQNAPNAVAKSLIVVALSMLWFSTFTLVRRHADWTDSVKQGLSQGTVPLNRWRPSHGLVKWSIIGASIVPAGIFVLAMAGAYEPAVFVMALAAIYVAAEHYCGLEKAKDDLQLGVRELGRHVGTLLNADGMNAWRVQLYREYREANVRIDAVVRYFDIDRAWWQCHATPHHPWVEYLERAKTQEDLLLNVLADEKCRAKAQFVADLPMAMATVVPRHTENKNERFLANYFRDLLGLAWQLAVMSEVETRRRDRAKKMPCQDEYCYVRIKISSAPAWMHVIDDKTYQIIERQELAQATVRELHLDIPGTPGKIRLSDWARRNVRNFAFRGTLGQEHLLSTLRSAALMDGAEKDHLNIETLEPILCALGMEEYLSSGVHRDFVIIETNASGTNAEPAFLPTRKIARKMCAAAFDAFLRQTFPGNGDILVRDLAGGLL